MNSISVKEKGLSFRELNFTVDVNIPHPKKKSNS